MKQWVHCVPDERTHDKTFSSPSLWIWGTVRTGVSEAWREASSACTRMMPTGTRLRGDEGLRHEGLGLEVLRREVLHREVLRLRRNRDGESRTFNAEAEDRKRQMALPWTERSPDPRSGRRPVGKKAGREEGRPSLGS